MGEELPPLPGRLAPRSQLAGYRTEEEIGQFFGTVDYVAPEQIQGGPLDGRTDQGSYTVEGGVITRFSVQQVS